MNIGKWLAVGGIILGGWGVALADEQEDKKDFATAGKMYFEQYCASCHGMGAKGDGPVGTTLRTKPADLTTLTKRKGVDGKFPLLYVVQTIDGRTQIGAHGPIEMPVWGRELTDRSGGRSYMARSMIRAIAHYIQTLQEK